MIATSTSAPNGASHQGDHDGVRAEEAVAMFRLIPHSQLAISPNADHFLIFQQPDKLLSTVATFLDAPAK